jgi:opacity protein-like surface antigen
LKKRLLAGVGLMALTAANSASAADMKLPPPPVAAWSWSGLYLGGHLGYGWGRDPFSDTVFSGKAPLPGIDSRGPLWGFQVGANWQAGAWVGGLEIDLSGTNIKGSSSTSSTITSETTTVSTSLAQADKFDLLGSARARIGYLPWPNLLLYGTGGPAWTRLVQNFEETIVVSAPNNPVETVTFSASEPSWRFGAVAGVGAEARLWDSDWLARVEYLHYDFGKLSSFSSSDGASSITGRLTADVLRAGLSYKFGSDRLVAGSAGTAVMPLKAPRAVAAWTWSGFYLGGHAGYGWGRDPFSNPFDSGTLVLTGIDSNGFVAGFQAGANWQSGAWVGGLEIDLSGTSITGSTSGTAPGVSFTGTETVTLTDKFELLGSARARLGYLAWPGTLLYGTGGMAWTRLIQTQDETEIDTGGGGTTTSTSSDPSWRLGWVAGLGAETRLGDTNWLARIEYLHYDFGDSGDSIDAPAPQFNQTSGHVTNDVIRAGLSYKLDWSGSAAGPARMTMPVKARPAATAWNWSGFYLGGHAGYGWGRDPMSDAVFGGKIGSNPLRSDINSQGLVGGFQAGANWQIGSWISGLEIDLSATSIKGSTTNVAPDGSTVETDTDKFDMLGSARGRLGYLAWPNVLLYGTGGLAWTRFVPSETHFDVGGGGGGGSSSPIFKFGWVAGAGGETRLWDSNWLLRVEYLHYDFGDSGSSFQSISGGGPTGSSVSTSGHLTADVVRTALSFKFD